MSDAVALPGVLDQIASLCGHPAALALADHFGGRRLYVPRREWLDADHGLVQAVGIDAARTIAQHFCGDSLEIPKADDWHISARNAQIRRERAAGASQSALAKRYRLTTRRIRQILGETDSPNLDLFS